MSTLSNFFSFSLNSASLARAFSIIRRVRSLSSISSKVFADRSSSFFRLFSFSCWIFSSRDAIDFCTAASFSINAFRSSDIVSKMDFLPDDFWSSGLGLASGCWAGAVLVLLRLEGLVASSASRCFREILADPARALTGTSWLSSL